MLKRIRLYSVQSVRCSCHASDSLTRARMKSESSAGSPPRKNITVDVFNEAGQKAISYNLYRCWVSEYQALPDLDAGANAVAITTIKLEFEWFERDRDVVEPSQPARIG